MPVDTMDGGDERASDSPVHGRTIALFARVFVANLRIRTPPSPIPVLDVCSARVSALPQFCQSWQDIAVVVSKRHEYTAPWRVGVC